MKKTLGFIIVLAVLLTTCASVAFADAWSVTHVVTGNDAIKLTLADKAAGKLYSYNYNGNGWTQFTSDEATVNVDPGVETVTIELSEHDTVGSETADTTKTISLARPDAPAASTFTVTPYTDAEHPGKISGVSTEYQYRNSTTPWTVCSGTSIDGCGVDSYSIRKNAAVPTTLASKITSIPVDTAVSYNIWIGGTEVTTAVTSGTGWSYNPAGKLTLTGPVTISGNHGGNGIDIASGAVLDEIIVNGDVTVTSTGVDIGDQSVGIYIDRSASGLTGFTISGNGTLKATALSTSTSTPVLHGTGITVMLPANATLNINSGVTIEAGPSNADLSSVGFSMDAGYGNTCQLLNKGTIKASSGQAPGLSNGLDIKGSVNNVNTITATANGTADTASSVAVSISENLLNTGTVTASGASADWICALLVDGLDNNGTINATTQAAGLGESFAISSSGLIENKANGNIKAVAGASSQGDSIAIRNTSTASPNIINSGIIDADANDANNSSTAVQGNVQMLSGILTGTTGTGSDDYGIDGTLDIAPASTSTALAVELTATKNALKTVPPTYNTNFTPEVYSGTDAAHAQKYTGSSITDSLYSANYVRIQRKDSEYVQSVSITSPTARPIEVEKSKTSDLTATVTMAPSTATYSGSYTWEILNASPAGCVTVASATTTTGSNTITGVSEGTATVKVTAGGQSDTAAVKVNKATPVTPTGINVSPTQVDLGVDKTTTITSILSPAGTSATVTWTITSGSDCLKIESSSTGPSCTVKGLKNGTATVTASAAGVGTAKAIVNVKKYAVSGKSAWYYDLAYSPNSHVITLNTTTDVDSITIDGVTVTPSSTSKNTAKDQQALEIPASEMRKISHGYGKKIVVKFEDGMTAEGKVAVISVKDAPPTGDVSLVPYVLGATLSALGAAGVTLGLKRKRR